MLDEKRAAIGAKQIEYLQKWKDGDQAAGHYFCLAYRGVVLKWVGRAIAMAPHVDRADLEAAGNIGILLGLNRFDPAKSPALAVCLEHSIRGEVMHYAHKNRSSVFSVKDSRAERRVLYGVGRLVAEAEANGATTSQAIDIAAVALGVSSEDVSRGRGMHTAESVEVDWVESECDGGHAAVERVSTLAAMQGLFAAAGLTAGEEAVLRYRFTDDEYPPSFEHFAQEWGVSREAARQWQKHALNKLRLAAESQGLEFADLV